MKYFIYLVSKSLIISKFYDLVEKFDKSNKSTENLLLLIYIPPMYINRFAYNETRQRKLEKLFLYICLYRYRYTDIDVRKSIFGSNLL